MVFWISEFGFVMEYFCFSIYGNGEFSWYGSRGWNLCSLSVCITSVQDLLAFIASGEKSGVILIGLFLFVT